MGMSNWRERWRDIEKAVTARGATGRWAEGSERPPMFDIDEPASEADVARVESELGRAIPASLRRVFREFAGRVCIEWQLSDEHRPPEQFRRIWAGECRWDLSDLIRLQSIHRKWIDACFTGKSTPEFEKRERDIAYDLVWHEKLSVLEVGNGDMVGIDARDRSTGSVIYLSHEDGEFHGYVLGCDFEDYVDRITALAFVGAEDWQYQPFMRNPKYGLDTACENAQAWRKWLGLPRDWS